MSSPTDDVTSSGSETFTGRVKWFNNKAGYGFITLTDGSRAGQDVFAHHSLIQVVNEQYKYLVQGEYVNLSLVKTTSGSHEFQAANICGINGGKLMCETRREFKLARSTPGQTAGEEEPVDMPKQRRTPRARGEGPREADKKTWSLAGKTDKPVRAPRKPRVSTDQTK
jgi:CspA family cold shock protein